jgi:tripartite-type tricarboxylate transporter receptor subunit TctC
MKKLAAGALAFMFGTCAALAQGAPSFQDKTITLIVGSSSGGGTDAYGRVVAGSLGKYLPGSPNVVVRNVPGVDGVVAMNYMLQQVAPDGLTIIANANTVADPLNYRKAQAHFNPVEFPVIGGAGRGGEVLMINKATEPRLYDKNAAPIVMGSLGGVPRSGMQMTAWGVEFLGWNVKWVVGYRGTNEITLALERGEIDMTSTGNLALLQRLVDTGKFKVLVQSGTLRNGELTLRPEFGDAPIMHKLVEGKIKDDLASKAFDYWTSIAVTDKWLALPPKTPQPIVDVYRTAYGKLLQDAEFIERGRKISEDFVPMSSQEVETLIKRLASLPPEATSYMLQLLQKQGLDVK